MGDGTVFIHSTRAEELPELAELDRVIFGNLSYPLFVLHQLYELAAPGLIVAETSGSLAGYVCVARAADDGVAWMLSLGVAPPHRSLGIGRSLAVAGIEAARAMHADELRLTVVPTNAAAVALYVSLGFERVREVADYFGPGEDRLFMSRVGDSL